MIVSLGLGVGLLIVVYWLSAYRLVSGLARFQERFLTWSVGRREWLQRLALGFCASPALTWAARFAQPRLRLESWWQQTMTSELQRQTSVFQAACSGISPLPRSLGAQELVNLTLQHRALDIYEQELALLRLHNDRIEFDLDITRARAEVQAKLLIATTQFEQTRAAIAYFGYSTWPTHGDYVALSGLSPLGELLAKVDS